MVFVALKVLLSLELYEESTVAFVHSIELCMVWTVPEFILLLEPWIVFLLLEFCLGEDLRLFLFLGVLVLVLFKNVLVINLTPSSIDIVVSSSAMLCIVDTPNATWFLFYYMGSQVWYLC